MGMIRVVLVRPQGPRNVGSVVRAVSNFGPAEIVLVAPMRPSMLMHPDFEQMSHGVENLIERLRVVATLPEALADCTSTVGFTARARGHRALLDWRPARKELIEIAADPAERLALVFGNEETGLSREDSELLNRLVKMPTSEEHRSINLAMTVGIALSTLFFDRAPDASASPRAPLKGEAREYLMRHVQEVLTDIATTDSIRKEIHASVERVFRRTEFETRDARAWHAIMRALGNRKSPMDYGLGLTQGGERRDRVLKRALGKTGDEAEAPEGAAPDGAQSEAGSE